MMKLEHTDHTKEGTFMNIKCKNCGGILEFDPELQKMVCSHCLSMFPVAETEKKHTTVFDSSHFSQENNVADELMDVDIYTCESCGAELIINDVELASYCVYCGQPSIVFSRTEKRLRPQYIIPFKISKNQAGTAIREKFVKSEYLDKDDKFFTPELLRGIYIPYGMFCFHANDEAYIKGVPYMVNKKQDHFPQYYYRKVFARIGHIPVDASFHFPNRSADKLEPFSDQDLTEFDSGFLSGYYADLRDEDFNLLRSRAVSRAKKILTSRLLSIPMVEHPVLIKDNPQIKCVKEIYALLPVWFMVIEHKGEKYTIMVNGQTGKVVGTLPVSYKKIAFFFIMSFIVCFLMISTLSLIAAFTGYFQIAFLAYALGSPLLLYEGIKKIRKYRRDKQLSTSETIKNFAKERQEY